MLMLTLFSFIAYATKGMAEKLVQLEFTAGSSATENATKTVFNVTLDSCMHKRHGDGYAVHCAGDGTLALFRYLGTDHGCAPHRLAALYPKPGQPLAFRDRLELAKVFDLPTIISDEDMKMNEVRVAIQNSSDVCGASYTGHSSTVNLQFTSCSDANDSEKVVEVVFGQCYHSRGHSVMVTCGNTSELQLLSFQNEECAGTALHNIEQNVCQATTLYQRLPFSVLRAFELKFANTHVVSSKARSLSYTITSADAMICGGLSERWKAAITNNPNATWKVLGIVCLIIVTPLILLIIILAFIITLCKRRCSSKKKKMSTSESERDSVVSDDDKVGNSCTVMKNNANADAQAMLEGAKSERVTVVSHRSKCMSEV